MIAAAIGWQEVAVAVIVALAAFYVIRVLLRASGVVRTSGRGGARDSSAPDVPVSDLVRKRRDDP